MKFDAGPVGIDRDLFAGGAFPTPSIIDIVDEPDGDDDDDEDDDEEDGFVDSIPGLIVGSDEPTEGLLSSLCGEMAVIKVF